MVGVFTDDHQSREGQKSPKRDTSGLIYPDNDEGFGSTLDSFNEILPKVGILINPFKGL